MMPDSRSARPVSISTPITMPAQAHTHAVSMIAKPPWRMALQSFSGPIRVLALIQLTATTVAIASTADLVGVYSMPTSR